MCWRTYQWLIHPKGARRRQRHLQAARRTASRKKCVGFAPHRQYIRGDAGSNEATSVAKLRLAQQGRVGRDSLVLRTGEEGLESFVASGCAMPV